MESTMNRATAFSPGHITGFFQICDKPEDPLLRGSRGAGFSIDKGVYTRVEAEPAERNHVTIKADGETTHTYNVSENVIKRVLSDLDQPYSVKVEHKTELLIGAGMGSSGAGALSLSLALNEALGRGYTRVGGSRYAHLAEIECKTGLGTVTACCIGGFGVLVKPGAPGIGEGIKFKHGPLAAVCVSLGPLPTEKALSNQDTRRRVNTLGGRYVERLRKDGSLEVFRELSRRFAEHVGLITPRMREILGELDDKGVPCSMAMFGETLFCLVESREAEDVIDLLKSNPVGGLLVAGIDERGARIV
jgi:pantoate kinase